MSLDKKDRELKILCPYSLSKNLCRKVENKKLHKKLKKIPIIKARPLGELPTKVG